MAGALAAVLLVGVAVALSHGVADRREVADLPVAAVGDAVPALRLPAKGAAYLVGQGALAGTAWRAVAYRDDGGQLCLGLQGAAGEPLCRVEGVQARLRSADGRLLLVQQPAPAVGIELTAGGTTRRVELVSTALSARQRFTAVQVPAVTVPPDDPTAPRIASAAPAPLGVRPYLEGPGDVDVVLALDSGRHGALHAATVALQTNLMTNATASRNGAGRDRPQVAVAPAAVGPARATVVTCRAARSTMTVMQTLHVPPDGWTVDEVPEIEGRWELVDGVLLVPPPEAPRNSRAALRLAGRLTPRLDDGWEVLIGGGLYFDQRNHRMPDLLVCRSRAVDAGQVRAGDVLLAVDVMSPSSVSTDRVTKPAQYAAAGIPHFWRFEPKARLLVTSELAGDVYRETARFDDLVAVREPVPLAFRLGDLFD